MQDASRFRVSLGLVVAAWCVFLLSPFLFLGWEDGARNYAQGALSAFLFWVPLLVATVCTFVVPRRTGIAVASIALAVPAFMVLSYGSGIGVIWLLSGLAMLAANLLRPRPPLVKASYDPVLARA